MHHLALSSSSLPCEPAILQDLVDPGTRHEHEHVVPAGATIAFDPGPPACDPSRDFDVDPLARLIERIRIGDEVALNALHAEAGSRLYGTALQLVRHPELAHEAVSSTFMQVWERAQDFSERRGAVMTWLMAIVRSRSLDMLRRARTRARYECIFDDDELDGASGDGADPIGGVERAQSNRRLSRAMTKLTPVQRQVLVLTFLEGFSQDEAARQLALPLGTLKSHSRRGLATLRRNADLRTSHG